MVEAKKKNPFQNLKEGLDDKEEQLAIISLFVRLGVVVWSGFIVTHKNDGKNSKTYSFSLY